MQGFFFRSLMYRDGLIKVRLFPNNDAQSAFILLDTEGEITLVNWPYEYNPVLRLKTIFGDLRYNIIEKVGVWSLVSVKRVEKRFLLF